MKWLALWVWTALLVFSTAGAEWETDFAKAKERAKKENKVLLLDFTGSDWCAGCMKLKKDVFSTPEFAAFAGENLVLVEVDFPMKKKIAAEQRAANEKLEQQYGIEGYPTVIIADADGKKVDMEEGYGGEGAKAYLKRLNEMVSKAKK